MFTKTDFWIGLAVGVVAGAFGYKFIQRLQIHTKPRSAGTAGNRRRTGGCFHG